MSEVEIKLTIACGQLQAALKNQGAVEEYEKTRGVYEHKGWTLKKSEASKSRIKCHKLRYPMGIKL